MRRKEGKKAKERATRTLMAKKKSDSKKACPYCRSKGQHKRACPQNPFNKTKRKRDTDAVHDFSEFLLA